MTLEPDHPFAASLYQRVRVIRVYKVSRVCLNPVLSFKTYTLYQLRSQAHQTKHNSTQLPPTLKSKSKSKCLSDSPPSPSPLRTASPPHPPTPTIRTIPTPTPSANPPRSPSNKTRPSTKIVPARARTQDGTRNCPSTNPTTMSQRGTRRSRSIDRLLV